MRHFDSPEEYADAVDALLDGTDPIVEASVDVQAVLEDLEGVRPTEVMGLLGEIASRTLVSWHGAAGLLTLGSVEPDREIGWCPVSVIDHSRTSTDYACPDRDLSVSEAAYYVLRVDLEDALAASEMEAR